MSSALSMRVLRRLLRRDRHVLTRVAGSTPAIYCGYAPRGAKAGDRLILRERQKGDSAP